MNEQFDTNREADAKQKFDERIDEKTALGLAVNTTAGFAYLFGFITGIIVFAMEKNNSFVRFHAMQSILFSASVFCVSIAAQVIPVFGWIVAIIIPPVSLIGWIYALIKAFQGQMFKFPFIGDMSQKFIA